MVFTHGTVMGSEHINRSIDPEVCAGEKRRGSHYKFVATRKVKF